MGLPISVKLEEEDRQRIDRALDLTERTVKILEKLASLLKEEKT